jgi:hypothetical protein
MTKLTREEIEAFVAQKEAQQEELRQHSSESMFAQSIYELREKFLNIIRQLLDETKPPVGPDGETKSDQAYQVIGTLASVGDCFDDPEVQRALDYFCEDGFDPDFLPFRIPSPPKPVKETQDE